MGSLRHTVGVREILMMLGLSTAKGLKDQRMCIYIYIHMYICVCMYICMCIYIYMYTYVYNI